MQGKQTGLQKNADLLEEVSRESAWSKERGRRIEGTAMAFSRIQQKPIELGTNEWVKQLGKNKAIEQENEKKAGEGESNGDIAIVKYSQLYSNGRNIAAEAMLSKKQTQTSKKEGDSTFNSKSDQRERMQHPNVEPEKENNVE